MRYKITTNTNKIILVDNEDDLSKALNTYRAHVVNTSAFTLKTKRQKTERIQVTLTPQQREKYEKKAQELGFASLQGYIKTLLLTDRSLNIITRYNPKGKN